jgi:hypothetical protein
LKKWLKARLPEKCDAIGALGLMLMVAGVARWSVNTALVLAGVMLFAYAFATAKPTKAGASDKAER